ncbi:MAG: hypothetical protein C0505_14595 [Leptothrix sp. (in: Bacteria)]|nr:hypothetical protein [Leptothrix sp. (in: b-proteobacteria)]
MTPTQPEPAATAGRSKTAAAWLAVLLGALGAHRFYLHGWRDPLGWLHLPPTLAGLVGVMRMRELGQDDRLAWVLVPVLGLMISVAMVTAIVHALTPDETWNRRHDAGHPDAASGWGAVLAAIVGLMVGGAVLMGTIAFSGQKFFEWQLEDRPAARP